MRTPSRTEFVAGQAIYIFDDVLDRENIESFYETAVRSPFTRGERDNAEDIYPIFSTDFQPQKFEMDMMIGQVARKLVTQYYPDIQYALFRAYVNMCHYGDVEYPHRDCKPDQKNITVLYYVNKEWDYRWAGETYFYEGQDTRLAIQPKPGRLVIFPGNVEHVGTIPTRICAQSRLTLALKYFIPVKAANS